MVCSIFQFFASLAELDIDRNKSDLRCRIQGSMIQVGFSIILLTLMYTTFACFVVLIC